MITYRFLQPEDYDTLSKSLGTDEYHTTTTPMFFVEKGTICTVYEDEKGIVLFLRGKANDDGIRLDIQFISNTDGKRNMRTMLAGFPELAERAKINGFNNIWFESDVPLLRQFCIKRLGFEESTGNVLKKVL